MEMLAWTPGPAELLIVLLIVLVVFGGSKLPQLARSLGQAKNEFEQGVAEGAANEADGEDRRGPSPS